MKPSKDKIDELEPSFYFYRDVEEDDDIKYVVSNIGKELADVIPKINELVREVNELLEQDDTQDAINDSVLVTQKVFDKRLDKLESQPEEQCKQCKRFYGSDVSGKQTLTIYACEEHAISKDPSPKKECSCTCAQRPHAEECQLNHCPHKQTISTSKGECEHEFKENDGWRTYVETCTKCPESRTITKKKFYTSEGDAVGEVSK